MNRSEQNNRMRFFQGPAWRWDLALSSPCETSFRRWPHGDALAKRAAHYVELSRSQGLDDATRLMPVVAAAHRLDTDGALVRKLKVLVLGGCEPQDIALRLDLESTQVDTWEKLFFDVRPVRKHPSWIMNHVVKPEAGRGDPRLANLMQLAATSGPDAAMLLLDLDPASKTEASKAAEVDWPLTESDRLLQRYLQWELNVDTALELVPTNGKAARFHLTRYVELLREEKKLELACRKLEEQVREAARQHELKVRRLDAKIARENRIAAQAAERTAALAARTEERAERQRTLRMENVLPAIPRLHRAATDRTA